MESTPTAEHHGDFRKTKVAAETYLADRAFFGGGFGDELCDRRRMPPLRFFPWFPDLLPARDELLDFPPPHRPSTPATSPDLPPHPPTGSTATTSPTSLPASSFADPTSRGLAKRPAPQTSPPPPRASTGSLPARERGRLQRLARPGTPSSLHICRGQAAHRMWGGDVGCPVGAYPGRTVHGMWGEGAVFGVPLEVA